MIGSARIFHPPANLRHKVGGSGFSRATIEQAEAALAAMSAQFDDWLNDEVAKLQCSWERVRTDGAGEEAIGKLYNSAHDLKGLGATYGYPIVTRLAASLTHAIGDRHERRTLPLMLLGGHVDAIRLMVKDGVRSDDNPMARELVETLEGAVAAARRPADDLSDPR